MNSFTCILAVVCAFSLSAFLPLAKADAQTSQPLSSFARVVVADDALPVTQAAAEELSEYVGKMLGKPLPIVPLSKYQSNDPGLSFFVGDAVGAAVTGKPLSPWKQEEYALLSVPSGLVLAGDDAKGDAWSIATAAGSMLAVYTLLDDHLGVKWFWPGPMGEHVPSGDGKRVPVLNIRQTPRFIIRSITLGYYRYHTPAFKAEARKWTRRSRLAWVPSATFGHSWYYAFDLKKTKSFDEHPDWFALVGGKRRPPQLCTSNPQVIDRMVEYVLAAKTNITTISPSDGGGFCECNETTKSDAHKAAGAPSCTSLDVPGLLAYDGKTPQLTDRIMTYANEIARRVAAKDPSKSVGIFAYTFYNKPPVNIKQLEPNIYLSFVFQAASMRDPEVIEQWDENIKGWQSKGAKMVLREGWGNHYYLDMPFPHEEQIASCVGDAAKRGFIASYGEGTKGFAMQSPNTWAVTRTLWDPSRDPKAMMDDYYQSAYGPVAEEMRQFFGVYSRALDERWKDRERILSGAGISYVNIVNSWHVVYPPAVVEQAEQWLAKAQAKAPPGEYAERLKLHRLGQDYTKVMTRLLECYRLLGQLGMKMEFFSGPTVEQRSDPAQKAALLKEAYELGNRREQLLLQQRDWAALDEGLYAFTNDKNIRQWHTHVKKELGINEPSTMTLDKLSSEKPAKNKAGVEDTD